MAELETVFAQQKKGYEEKIVYLEANQKGGKKKFGGLLAEILEDDEDTVEIGIQTDPKPIKTIKVQTDAPPKEDKKQQETVKVVKAAEKTVEKPTPRQTPLKQSKTVNLTLESQPSASKHKPTASVSLNLNA